jgi:hypothetical protein
VSILNDRCYKDDDEIYDDDEHEVDEDELSEYSAHDYSEQDDEPDDEDKDDSPDESDEKRYIFNSHDYNILKPFPSGQTDQKF